MRDWWEPIGDNDERTKMRLPANRDARAVGFVGLPEPRRCARLAGTWTDNASSEHGEGAASTHIFRISANASVVMETMFPDTEHEMINMDHLDGDTLESR